MSIIFSEDINDNRGEDLNKRVDTIYDYIAYMKEQLEFWARNRTREISGADAKIDSAVESIAENAEAIAENTDAIADLEPRIQTYEDSLPIGETEITVHKPMICETTLIPADGNSPYRIYGKDVSNSSSGIVNVSVSADSYSGYAFYCWVGVASVGFVGTPYIENYNSSSTKIWDRNGASGSYRVWAMYRRTSS